MRHGGGARRRSTVQLAVSAAAAAGLAVALVACSGPLVPTPSPTPTVAPTPVGDGVLVVGTLTPLTGPEAALGAAEVAGVNAALREITAAGGVLGVAVTVVNRDSSAADAQTQLLDAGVDVIIGQDGVLSTVDAGVATPVAGTGLQAGFVADDAFTAKVRQEDPGVGDVRGAAEAYDATVLAALAAIRAHDDAGSSIATALDGITTGEVSCASFGACADVLLDRSDIGYVTVSGVAPTTDAG